MIARFASKLPFSSVLALTYGVAAISFLSFGYLWLWGMPLPVFLQSNEAFGLWLRDFLAGCMFVGPAVWLVITTGFLLLFKRRGLWALAGFPFAAAPIGFVALLLYSCSAGHGCV